MTPATKTPAAKAGVFLGAAGGATVNDGHSMTRIFFHLPP